MLIAIGIAAAALAGFLLFAQLIIVAARLAGAPRPSFGQACMILLVSSLMALPVNLLLDIENRAVLFSIGMATMAITAGLFLRTSVEQSLKLAFYASLMQRAVLLVAVLVMVAVLEKDWVSFEKSLAAYTGGRQPEPLDMDPRHGSRNDPLYGNEQSQFILNAGQNALPVESAGQANFPEDTSVMERELGGGEP